MKGNDYWLKSFEDGDGTNEIQSLHNNYGLNNDLIKLGLSMGTFTMRKRGVLQLFMQLHLLIEKPFATHCIFYP
jgi:hypothetical protein